MVADEDSKNYMGAVITHNTEHSKKARHLVLRFRITTHKPTEKDLPRKKSSGSSRKSSGSSSNNKF